MRNTKLALTIGIMALAVYGCGDSSSATRKDAAGADAAKSDANTATNTSTSTSTNTATTTVTDTSTATQTSVRVDAGVGIDGPVASPDTGLPTPVDGDDGIDSQVVVVPLDGGAVDSGATIDGSPGVDGGATTDAPLSTDGTIPTSKCEYPACFVDLAKDCGPEGSCVQQTIPPSGSLTGPWTTSTTACYANGVKMEVASSYSLDLGTRGVTGTTTTTYKNAAGICYALDTSYSAVTLTNITYTVKNAAGATVATMVVDATAGTQTITCTGQAPVVLPLNCESSGIDGGSVGACTTGTCTF